MREVVVTGGSGKAGRAVVRDLLEAGYDVLNADIVESGESLCQWIKTALTDLGETFEVLREASLRSHRRGSPALPGIELCPLQVNLRRDGTAVLPHYGHDVRGPAHLQHHGGARRLREVPHLPKRSAATQVEPVGLRGRPRRGPGLPPRVGGGPRGSRSLHRGGGRHGHGKGEP